MTKRGKLKYLVAIALCAAPAFPQGCALCYTQAAGGGADFIAALRSGIMALLLPPMFMFAAITWLAYRKRNQFRDGLEAQAGTAMRNDE